MYYSLMNKHTINKIHKLDAETRALAQTLKQQLRGNEIDNGQTVSDFVSRIVFLIRKLPYEFCSSLLLLAGCEGEPIRYNNSTKMDRILSEWEEAVIVFKNHNKEIQTTAKSAIQELWESRCANIRRRELTEDHIKSARISERHIEDIKALRDKGPGAVDNALDQVESLPDFEMPPVPHIDIDKLFSAFDQEEAARCQELKPLISQKATKIWQIWNDLDTQLNPPKQAEKEE